MSHQHKCGRAQLGAIAVTILLCLATCQASNGQDSKFSPVIYRTIADESARDRRFLIDLDTGEIKSPPPEVLRDGPIAAFRWMAEEGIDAMCEGGGDGLLGIDMVALHVDVGAAFPNFSNKQLERQLEFLSKVGKPGTPIEIGARAGIGPQATYVFKTREGAMGVVQLTGWDAESNALRIAYRLLLSSVDAIPDVDVKRQADPSAKSSSSEVVELVISPKNGRNFLDLDTGALVATTDEDLYAWDNFIRSKSVDVQVKPFKTREVRFHRTVLVGVSNRWFEDPALVSEEVKWIDAASPWKTTLYRSSTAFGEEHVPATYLYKTAEESVGLIQISSWNDEQQTVRIRYRTLGKS